jgi:hypothetical protein
MPWLVCVGVWWKCALAVGEDVEVPFVNAKMEDGDVVVD